MTDIARARTDDIPAIAELARQAFTGTGDAWSEAQYASELQAQAACVWVVRQGPGIVAFLVARRVPGELDVLQLAVAPGHRLRGLGRALLEQAMAGEAVTAHLEVRAANRAARAFYAALGFREVGRRPGYYRDGSDALRLCRLAAVVDT